MSDRSPIAASLLAWHAVHGRHDLPWQQQPTPYRVWVSEVMLQQTQVQTVLGYYARFMRRFPDLRALAVAPLDDVLHLWAGLGYYRRARHLQRAAQCIVEHHGGELPQSLESLCALPGIGRSTAAAILALSAGRRETILDGNVKRVLARYFAVAGPISDRLVERELWRLADICTPRRNVARYTQAIMDLGALACVRPRPLCSECPLRTGCRAHAQGRELELPQRRTRAARRERHVVMLVARRGDGSVLLHRRPPQGIWGGLWSLPEFASLDEAQGFGVAQLRDPRLEPASRAPVHHAFTHFDLDIAPLVAECSGSAAVMDGDGVLWYNPAAPARVGLPAPVQRIIESVTEP
jgi:A/G-specific adenine glycosylase